MKYIKLTTLLTFCLFVFASCDSGKDVDTPGNKATAGDTEVLDNANDMQDRSGPGEDNVMMEDKTIAQIVEQSEELSILQQALTSSDMMNMLGSGSYTLLAPTNDAFEELDEGQLEQWLMSKNRDFLSKVLQYHVISREVTAADLADTFVYASVLGSPLNFDVESDGEINVNDHEVEYVIQAQNGVIYVMSEVLMPDDIDNDLGDM